MRTGYAGPSAGPLRPNADAAFDFLSFWFKDCNHGLVELGWLNPDNGKLTQFRRFDLADLEDAAVFAATVNAQAGANIYFRACTVKETAGQFTTDADFCQAPGGWADHDEQASVDRLSTHPLAVKPSALIITGRVPHMRAQTFWPMTEPMTSADMVRSINQRLAAYFRSDPQVVNPTRLMRLAGSIAWPVKEGRSVVEQTTVLFPTDGRPKRLTLHYVQACLPAQQEAPRAQSDASDAGGWRGTDLGLNVAALLRSFSAPEQWHNSLLRLTAHWVGRGWSDEEILAVADHVTLPGFTVQQTREELLTMIKGAREKWGIASHNHTVGSDGGPAAPFEGQPIDPWDTLRPPPFPMTALPPVLSAFVSSRARAIGCDPAAVAFAALSALSAAMDGRWRLRLKQHDGWSVPPALWVALIGPSSAKKSPAIRAAWRHLEEIQSRALKVWMAQVAEWEATPKEMREAKPPQPPRFVTHDATMEALQGILSHQDRGCGVLRDELAGFIGQMDKYSSGRGGAADRAFWLQAFDGGSFVADRVGRGTVAVENLLVSLCGGIQPDRLAAFGDLTDDGLWQRFLPIVMAPAGMGEDVPAGDEEAAYAALIEQALRAPPMLMKLSETARPIRDAAERRLFEIEQSDALGGRFSSFIGKLSGLWGRLALVLEIADGNELGWVGREAAERASTLIFDYLIPSAARVYSTISITSGKGEPGRDVAGFILTKKLPRLLASDLTRNIRACRGMTLPEVNETVSPLVAGGWLAPERSHGGNNAWLVNPTVHTAFAERAEREAARRRHAAELMQDDFTHRRGEKYEGESS